MSQTPKHLQPARSVLHFVGAEIRRLRVDLGMSQADLGSALFVHKDLIRKIESAERMPTDDLVDQCDRILAADGELRRLLPMLRRERALRVARDTNKMPARFRAEATDRPVLDWLLSSGHDARWAQEGEEDTMVNRLRRLRGTDHRHGAASTYPDLADALTQLGDMTDRAPQLATGYLELAGYEAVDLGADGLAQQHYLRALAVTIRSGDRLYGGYLIAVSLAHLALHCGDADQAARLAAAALSGIEHAGTPAVRAACRAVLARAHARRGDEAACVAALLQAEADLARSRPGAEPAWIGYFGEADLADEKAHCFFDLGLHELAQREATRAVALVGPQRVRRLAIDTSLYATSLARSRQIEQACVSARQAIDLASAVASFRSAHRIVLMLAELQPHHDRSDVRAVNEYAHTRLPVLFSPAPAVPLP
ncbi:MAG TPA: helix-turn-helix transcriptional regulator [Actinoplanes sp.]|jgi:transcriptional regulator with XRE-family HTH domain